MKLERRTRRSVRSNVGANIGATALIAIGALTFLFLTVIEFIHFLVSPEK
jgi:hypothetical protein